MPHQTLGDRTSYGLPVLHFMVGLPGTGKTSFSRALALSTASLLLSPDEWMRTLFGDPLGADQRELLEGRFIRLALDVLALGQSVILDFGFWASDERYAVRAICEMYGVQFEFHYFTLPDDIRRARCLERRRSKPSEFFPFTDVDFDFQEAAWVPPKSDELVGGPLPDPPEPHRTWIAWAYQRWRVPGLEVLDI